MSTAFVSDLTLDESLVSAHISREPSFEGMQAEEVSREGSPSLGDENVSPCLPSLLPRCVIESLSSPESLGQQTSPDLPSTSPPKVQCLQQYSCRGN